MSSTDSADYDAQHTRLLDGLAASIREKGLASTQLGDIVRHAHASRRTFYKHFPDKDACFVDLARRVAEVVRTQVTDAIDPTAPWTTQIEQGIDAYLGILAADPAMSLTFATASVGESIIRARLEAMERYAALVMDALASDAFGESGPSAMSFERSFMLVSGLHETVHRAVARGEDVLLLAPELRAVFKSVIASSLTEPATSTHGREPGPSAA
jgi:AcrR family transcriptional regulator